jgi:Flp pilus assembly protein TadG
VTGPRDPRSDRGVSTIELAMFTPLLFFVIFLIVQASLFFLGNQAASAAAREAARAARTSDASDPALDDAEARGRAYATSIGHGLIEDVQVDVTRVGTDEVRATVTAHGVRLVPGIPGGDLTQVVQGPIEKFRPDL